MYSLCNLPYWKVVRDSSERSLLEQFQNLLLSFDNKHAMENDAFCFSMMLETVAASLRDADASRVFVYESLRQVSANALAEP